MIKVFVFKALSSSKKSVLHLQTHMCDTNKDIHTWEDLAVSPKVSEWKETTVWYGCGLENLVECTRSTVLSVPHWAHLCPFIHKYSMVFIKSYIERCIKHI